MRNKKNKKIAIIALSCAFTCFAALGITATARGGEEFSLTEEFLSEYTLNYKLAIPAGYFGDIKADCTVIFPSGAAYKKSVAELTEAGLYEVDYYAVSGGKTYIQTKRFKVSDELYSVDKPSASAIYATDYEIGSEKVNGILVTLTDGSTFKYNKVFDISDKTADDLLVRFNIIATETGRYDFKKITVRFTDIYDEKNYFDINVSDSYGNGATCFAKAGASNQTLTGLQWMPDANHPEVPSKRTDDYGTYVRCNFRNTPNDGNRATETFDAYFDYAEKKAYGSVKDSSAYAREENGMMGNYICDLDDPLCYNNLWDGFAMGECKVSVFAESFASSYGTILLTDIFGESGEDFAVNLMRDEESPEIIVDTGYAEDRTPYAIVGKEYKIFPATSKDSSRKTRGMVALVYRDYYGENPVSVTVENGVFVPDKAGDYAIVYRDEDLSGNAAEKVITVKCYAADEKSFTITAENPQVEATVGRSYKVGDYSITGGSGKAEVEIFAEVGEGKYPIAENGEFTPTKSGEYTITYVARDYAGITAKTSYELNVEFGNEPIFEEVTTFPANFVSTFEQFLPKLRAYDYKNAEWVNAEIFVKEGDGEERKLGGNSMKPSESDSPYDITVVYRANGKSGTSEISFSRTCYTVTSGNRTDRIIKKNMFITGEGVTSGYGKATDGDNIEYAEYNLPDGKSLTYVNDLPATSSIDTSVTFALKDKIPSALYFTFTDAFNPAVSVTAELFEKDGTACLRVNGGVEYSAENVSLSGGELITVAYSAASGAITVNGSAAIAPAISRNFAGFEKGVCRLTITVKDETRMVVTSILNQLLSSQTEYRERSPLFSLVKEYLPEYYLGEKVTLHGAVALSLINPTVQASVTLYAPDGSPVKDVNGELIKDRSIYYECEFIPVVYGTYEIRYTINGADMSYYIDVADEIAPEITINQTVLTRAKKGDKINYSATAKDNLDGDVKVITTITDPTGRIRVINGEYAFTKTGEYILSFTAKDTRGNVSQKTYRIIVKG